METELELAARGPGPFVWRFPVSSSREITATIGGATVPIAVEPGGATARIVLPGAGNYLLALRRQAATRKDESGAEVLRLLVNATPSARLIVAPASGSMPQGVPETRGRMERQPDGSLDGRLGPSDRIVIRWPPAGQDREVDARPSGSVEGLILWDVTPAGDRVRARLTCHREDAIASVRVAHKRGVVLRSARVSGGGRVYVADDPGETRWTFSFDPPMPATGTLSLDCWQTASESSAPDDRSEDGPASRDRTLPTLEPEGFERYSGLLGVRRPGDWTGRLVPRRDPEPVDDESFVKAWGSLPDEPLTFCGTSRLGRDNVASLSTGPAPHRIDVRPTVQLRIESGRIVVLADAEVIQTSAPSPILEAKLPEGMRVTGVIGEGLIDWAVGPGRRLHLCWRRGETHARRIVRILGWIPVAGDPLEFGGGRRRIRTPWIGWPGAEASAGSLLVYSPSVAEIAGARGLSPAPSPSTATSGRGRATVAVARPEAIVPGERSGPARRALVGTPAASGHGEHREPARHRPGVRRLGRRDPI